MKKNKIITSENNKKLINKRISEGDVRNKSIWPNIIKKALLKKKYFGSRYKNQPELAKVKFNLYSNYINSSCKIDQETQNDNHKNLTNYEKKRWNRQLIHEFVDQWKIKASKIACFGLGGIGSNALLGLLYCGVQNFKIIDYDLVDLSNLNRQTLYTPADVNEKKVNVAKKRMTEINPHINIQTYDLELEYPVNHDIFLINDSQKSSELIKIENIIDWADYIINAVDYKGGPFLINDLCVLKQKPFYWAGVNRNLGEIFPYKPRETPCLRCLFSNNFLRYKQISKVKCPNLGTTAILTGNLIAELIIHDICRVNNFDSPRDITGNLLIFDFLKLNRHKVPVYVVKECICQDGFS